MLLILNFPFLLYGDSMIVFHLSHDKRTVGTSYRIYRSQFIKHKILVVFHIPYLNFQKKIKISGNIVAFRNFFNF